MRVTRLALVLVLLGALTSSAFSQLLPRRRLDRALNEIMEKQAADFAAQVIKDTLKETLADLRLGKFEPNARELGKKPAEPAQLLILTDGRLFRYDPEGKGERELGTKLMSAALSPDGKWLACAVRTEVKADGTEVFRPVLRRLDEKLTTCRSVMNYHSRPPSVGFRPSQKRSSR